MHPEEVQTIRPNTKLWLIISTILASLTLVPPAIYILFWSVMGFDNDVVGLALILTLPLLLFSLFMVITDILVALVYLLLQKPRGKKLVFPVTVMLLGIIILWWFITRVVG